ncbi:MAG: type II toxin-antitoxin system VapC family toxin [Beijerinckiaceae bacterium]
MDPAHLIDTNIVSELARKNPNAGVMAFIGSQPRLLVSSILFHELTFGLENANPDQKVRLTMFIAAMRERFGAKALPVDVSVAETAGRLRAFEKKQGRVLTVADALIAATAVVKGAVLVTRNTKDFESLGLPLLNPFSDRSLPHPLPSP